MPRRMLDLKASPGDTAGPVLLTDMVLLSPV